MLINLSNHPLTKWSKNQIQAAEKTFGTIIDLSFPAISPEATLEHIKRRAQEYVEQCLQLFDDRPDSGAVNVVHIMGEMTFVYQFVRLISENGILCVASTSNRIVRINEKGVKCANFEFVQFRAYCDSLY